MQFTTAMQFISQWEWGNRADGGYTNNPADPGGETKYGISKRGHPTVDIKNLTLAQAFAIYKSEYWDAAGCDKLPSGMDMCVFDAAINSGVSQALKWHKNYNTVKTYLEARRIFYLGLKNPTFIQGWLNRLNDLSKFITIHQ